MGKRSGLFLFGIMLVMLFASCGKEKESESGIDGYVYLAEQVSIQELKFLALNCQQVDGELYYSSDGCLYALPVEELPDFQKANEVMRTYEGNLLQIFGVDEEGNIYWESDTYMLASLLGQERCLYKYIAQTGKNVRLPMPLKDEMVNAIVPARGGKVYLLLDNAIWELDQDGNLLYEFSTDEYRRPDASFDPFEKLIADSAGNLFYLEGSFSDAWVRVLYQGTREWVELPGLPEMFSANDFFLTGEGKIFVNADDALYEYDPENAHSTAVLRFAESYLDKNSIKDFIYLDEEHFIVIGFDLQTDSEMYLLTRTPVEEMPHKQTIVLASLFPSANLEKAVTQFNRMSEEYIVVIERYGAGLYGDYDRTQAAITRLDSSLVSSNSPDLLDLNMLTVATYAEKNALADLYPYLEKSSLLKPEDYLENVIEGYTVNGRLVCLPVSFYLQAVIGRASQVGSEPGWTFEDLNTVLEKYPNMKLFRRNFMFYYFVYDYYLNTFIDFETGECNFDSDEFREFVQWINNYSLSADSPFAYEYMYGYMPADMLLDEQVFPDFNELNYQRMRFGGDVTFIGYVTKMGTPSYNYQANDPVGILEHSKHKDGAWAFLEYFLFNSGNNVEHGFPTNRNALIEMAQAAMKKVQEIDMGNGEVYINNPVGSRYLDNELVPIYAPTQEEVDIMLEAIENIDFTQVSSFDGVVSILMDELELYYNGQKSLEEVTQIINNRVQLMVNERLSSG